MADLDFQQERKEGLACVNVACAQNNSAWNCNCSHGDGQIDICYGYVPDSPRKLIKDQS
jgi:hypothetical protein